MFLEIGIPKEKYALFNPPEPSYLLKISESSNSPTSCKRYPIEVNGIIPKPNPKFFVGILTEDNQERQCQYFEILKHQKYNYYVVDTN